MPINLVQTDELPVCNASGYCSGHTLHSGGTLQALARENGTPGVTQLGPLSVNNGATLNVCFSFDCQIPSGATWSAGNWTVPINFTNGANGLFLSYISICRVNVTCTSQQTIAAQSVTPLHETNTGLTTQVLSGVAATPSADDRIAIVLSFNNTNPHGNQTFGITPDQTIICPFDGPAPPAAGNLLSLLGVG